MAVRKDRNMPTRWGWGFVLVGILQRCRADGALECDGMTSLSLDATCRVGPKRGHVRALQIRKPNSAWAALHRAELRQAWELASHNEEPSKIAPLE